MLFAHAVAAVEMTETQRAGMRAADVVILGEIHDNAAHHAGQGRLMEMLKPAAVVFEMLTPEMAEGVAHWDGVDLAGLGEEIGWREAGWPAITLYAPVFDALGDAAVIGAALPRDRVRAAFADGAAGVFGDGGEQFGLDRDLPSDMQEARMQMQFEAHCEAMPLAMMGGMVEAQRLRDAAFAAATLDALERYGRPVVVITGNGHARKDWGMPALIALADPGVTLWSVGFVETPRPLDDPRFDLTVATEPAPRDDPCAAFN